jgi:4-alpha-glucanotransferase
MTDPWGIDDSYEDAFGRRHGVSPEIRARIMAAMKIPAGEEAPPTRHAMRFVREHNRGLERGATIALEGGGERRVEGEIPRDLPWGYHELREDDRDPTPLVVSPHVCRLPERTWGLAVQLYSARSRESWGIGDLADLRRLAGWSARELGASVMLVNPLGAAMPLDTQHASPYFPSSRRYRSPLYLRIEEIEGAGDFEEASRAGRALNERPDVDRDAVWRLKKHALEAIYTRRAHDESFDRWRADQGSSLERYARFCVLSEHFQAGWRRWPEAYQHPDRPEVAAFASERADRVRFHAWIQYELDRQVDAASKSLILVQDLPIGFDTEGADGWADQDCLALDVAVGAPPDPFNERGQEWGLPPFIPWKLREMGYQPFIDTLRAYFGHGGGLRIDHVMGLFRLFWIPRGVEALEGTYVHYPAEDMLDLLALESQRAGAFVVGEDLGTVPHGVREELWHRHILSYRLLWFEPAPPEHWPERAMAAVNTHDLPTVPGLWSGADLEDQRRWGFDPGPQDDIKQRLMHHGGVGPEVSGADAVRAAYRALARTPCRIALASIEDLLLVRERPNLPGMSDRPNWCHALPSPLEEIEHDALVHEIAAMMRHR